MSKLEIPEAETRKRTESSLLFSHITVLSQEQVRCNQSESLVDCEKFTNKERCAQFAKSSQKINRAVSKISMKCKSRVTSELSNRRNPNSNTQILKVLGKIKKHLSEGAAVISMLTMIVFFFDVISFVEGI